MTPLGSGERRASPVFVEVLLLDGALREVRHLSNTFAMECPYHYG